MFRSKNSSTTSGGDGGGDNVSSSSSRIPRFTSLFFKKKQPKRRKRPEIKLVFGDNDNGCKGREVEDDEGGEEALERRAKEEKDVANRHKRDRLMLLDSQGSAASGDKSTSLLTAPAAAGGPEDSNRTAATPSDGIEFLAFPREPFFRSSSSAESSKSGNDPSSRTHYPPGPKKPERTFQANNNLRLAQNNMKNRCKRDGYWDSNRRRANNSSESANSSPDESKPNIAELLERTERPKPVITRGIVGQRAKMFENKIVQNELARERMQFLKSKPSSTTMTTSNTSSSNATTNTNPTSNENVTQSSSHASFPTSTSATTVPVHIPTPQQEAPTQRQPQRLTTEVKMIERVRSTTPQQAADNSDSSNVPNHSSRSRRKPSAKRYKKKETKNNNSGGGGRQAKRSKQATASDYQSSTDQLCNTDSSLHDFYDDDDYNDQPDLTLQNDNSIITFCAGGTDDTDTEEDLARELEESTTSDFPFSRQYSTARRRNMQQEQRSRFFESLLAAPEVDTMEAEEGPEFFMARFRSKSSSRQQQQQKVDPIRASKTAGTTTTAMASTKGFPMWGRRKEIRPPSSASSEDGGGCRCKEFMASQHIQQDMVSVKTYLHRLRRILQDAETATLNSQNSLSEELQFSRQNSTSLDEMSDLKRQVVLLQQQGEDKDRTIRQLQRQLEEAANRSSNNNSGVDVAAARSPPVNGDAAASNVATQTDRQSPLPRTMSTCSGASSPPPPSSASDSTRLPSGSASPTSCSRGHSSTSEQPQNSYSNKKPSLRRTKTPIPRRSGTSPSVIMCSDENGTLRIPIRTARAKNGELI